MIAQTQQGTGCKLPPSGSVELLLCPDSRELRGNRLVPERTKAAHEWTAFVKPKSQNVQTNELVANTDFSTTGNDHFGFVVTASPTQSCDLPPHNALAPGDTWLFSKATGGNFDTGFMTATTRIDQAENCRNRRGLGAAVRSARTCLTAAVHNCGGDYRLVDNIRIQHFGLTLCHNVAGYRLNCRLNWNWRLNRILSGRGLTGYGVPHYRNGITVVLPRVRKRHCDQTKRTGQNGYKAGCRFHRINTFENGLVECPTDCNPPTADSGLSTIDHSRCWPQANALPSFPNEVQQLYLGLTATTLGTLPHQTTH